MKVAYYCQHVLGIGHFQRSLEICRAFARKVPTTLILGGPDIEIPYPELKTLRLPGLQMDSNFENLQPCVPGGALAQVKKDRVNILFDHFRKEQPDVFITELYPFGRKAFRFELDPILGAIHEGGLKQCLRVCSVRDILVEKEAGREKHERRVVDTINNHFDGILVHSDPEIIKLDETFSSLHLLAPPIHYTGYVAAEQPTAPSNSLRKKFGLTTADTLIIVSIGSGSVGSELLEAALAAVEILHDESSLYLQIFCGPYCRQDIREGLEKRQNKRVWVRGFTSRFPEWLQAADLSISMAGYNTCMNLVREGIPAIVYPFKQNREQHLRAKRLGSLSPIEIIDNEPTGEILAAAIRRQLRQPRVKSRINLNGATDSARQTSFWFRHLPRKFPK